MFPNYPAAVSHPAGRKTGDGGEENLSWLFQDYYSAVTSHFTLCGDRELVGWRTAKDFCPKTHTLLFLKLRTSIPVDHLNVSNK